jgi:hypothetical protein
VFTAREREEIIGHLLGRDISTVILTPTQKQAIIQENLAKLDDGLDKSPTVMVVDK